MRELREHPKAITTTDKTQVISNLVKIENHHKINKISVLSYIDTMQTHNVWQNQKI